MRRTLKILTVILAGIVIIYGCDSGGSDTLNPTITDVQPESGPLGTEVTLTGSDFSPNPTDNSVTFGGTSAPVHSATETQIETEVPQGIEFGEAEVQVSVDGNRASGPGFIVEAIIKNQILFASDRDGDFEIFRMNTDGSNPQKITNNDTQDYGPAVSNDGKQIAFTSERTGTAELFIMNADGTEKRQLTTNGVHHFNEISAYSWSPDDSKIALVKEPEQDPEIYTIRTDGSELVRLTNSSGFDRFPDWSPNGNKIVFTSNRNLDDDIYIMNSDGSNVEQLTDTESHSWSAAWSPDASQLVYTFGSESEGDLYIIDRNGTNPQQITNLSSDNNSDTYHSSWAPNGSEIVFHSSQNGQKDIYKVSSDGSGSSVNLTSTNANDQTPHWSPVE